MGPSDVRSRTQALDSTPFTGHLYEPLPQFVHTLEATYQNIVVHDGVNASTFPGVLEQDGVPRTLDFLKYDTDGADCDAIFAALDAGFRPHVILAEFNLLFPPPLRFNLPYTKGA